MSVATSPKAVFEILLSDSRDKALVSCFYALATLILFAVNSNAATIVVPPSGDLQAAIDAAQFGDTIILQAGGSYLTPGAPYWAPFYLGPKSGGTGTDADFITIRSSNISALPTGRVSPQDRPNLAKIVALGYGGAFNFLANARYWKLQGLEITNSSDGTSLHHVNNFITIGGVAGVAHSWVDRCYIHPQEDGTAAFARTASHGIVVNSPASGANVYDTRITNSRISGFGGTYAHGPTQLIDALALGTNVLDTILVDNNFLSATYQPWFPGGGDPVNPKTAVVQGSPAPTLTTATLSNVNGLSVGDYMTFPQSDANSRHNGNARITAISGTNITFTPMTRFTGGAPEPPVVGSTVMWGGDVGRNYTVTHNTFDIDPVLAQAALTTTGSYPKGYIEMKMGLNVYLEGNIFQGWPSAIAIQGVNQNSDTPWVTVSDFTFRNNWVRDFGTCFIINMGNPTGAEWDINRLGENLVIENNLFTQNTTAGETKIMTAVNLGPNASIRHNTWVTRASYDGPMTSIVSGGGSVGMTIKDNIWFNSRYGWGNLAALAQAFPSFPNSVEAKNAIINNISVVANADIQSVWPNSYVGSATSNPILFTGSNPSVLTDWQLAPGSPYRAGGARQASDATDVGVNFVRLSAALAGGSEPPPPTPTPTPIPIPTVTPVPTPTPVVSPSPTPTPVLGDQVPVTGYVRVNGDYFGGTAVVTLSTASGEFIKSTVASNGGYFAFDYGVRGNILTATSAGYVFESKTIDGSAYYIISGTPSGSPTPVPATGYLKVNGDYFAGTAMVTLSTASGEFIKSTVVSSGGYFAFDYGVRGNILTAMSAGYVFESKTIDGSAYYIISGTPSGSPTPVPATGYLKVNGDYFAGTAVVKLSTASGELIKSIVASNGGYFEFDYGVKGNVLTATSAGYVFESKIIDGSPYYIINGTPSESGLGAQQWTSRSDVFVERDAPVDDPWKIVGELRETMRWWMLQTIRVVRT